MNFIRGFFHTYTCLAALTILSISAGARAADLELVATRASGIEGVDWEFGDTGGIVLFAGDQMVEVQALITGFGPQVVAGYEMALDCDSLAASVIGVAEVIDTDCTAGEGTFGVDYCLGVDESEPTYILAAASSTIAACQNVQECPGGGAGDYACGAIILQGDSGPDNGMSYYASTFAVYIPADLRGKVTLSLNNDPLRTYLRDDTVAEIPIDSLSGSPISLPIGACCGASGFPLECGDGFTIAECNAAGGVLVNSATCSGEEGCVAGIDSTCPTCLEDTECDDGNACTADDCGVDGCCSTMDSTPSGQCCAPDTGDLTAIDDGNECTIDVCNPDGTVDHNADNGASCDDGDPCTINDVCDAAMCAGTLAAQSPAVSGVGSRGLSVSPEPAGASDSVALLVTSTDWACLSKYINADGELQDTPVFQTINDWGTIIVSGEDIVPESTYDVQAECGSFLSVAGSGTTGIFGDIDNSGSVNLSDVQLVVFGFQLNFKFNTLEELDIWPCLPNGTVNFEDIQHTVLAFQQVSYEDQGCPLPCP